MPGSADHPIAPLTSKDAVDRRTPAGCGVGFADVQVLVIRPPWTRRAAELVAAEIRTLCREFWPIERPGTALTTVREIADYVKDAPFWGLWWD